jgi:hypothetical protein
MVGATQQGVAREKEVALMRRIISLVVVVLVMAALVLASVVPAFAVKPSEPPGAAQNHPGQYVCVDFDPEFIVVENVPRGQTALFEEQGFECFPQRG